MEFYDMPTEIMKYQEIDEGILEFAKIISQQGKKTYKGSLNGDTDSAMDVIELDDEINIKKYELNLMAIEYLKSFTPKEKKLRKVYSINLITDKFDRVSNNFKKINKALIRSNDFTQGTKLDLTRMIKHINNMVDLLLESLKSDVLCDRFEILKIEEKLRKIFKSEIDKGDDRSYNYQHYLIFKHIERIGDYIKGIYEQLYFIEKGKYIEL